jgi:ABC-2 type transport system permease protein
MTTPSNAMPNVPLESQGVASQVGAPAGISPTRRMYWSIRREIWEHRSIYIAPLAAAAVFLAGFLIRMIRLPAEMAAASSLNPAHQQDPIEQAYAFAAALIMGTAFLVGIFYSLDALYAERRDRSILFWKSLPVSDLTTVLSKLTIPLFILPLLSFAIAVVTQFVMLLLSSAVLLGSGLSVGPLWARMSFFHMSLMLLYHMLTVHGLWYAPIYGWLLLVSAWAPRAPFLWAFLPPFVVWGLEKIAFQSSHFLAMLQYRLTGPQPSTTAPGETMMDTISALTPAQFFSTPGLWLGLIVAAIFLAAAVRLRRYREPI